MFIFLNYIQQLLESNIWYQKTIGGNRTIELLRTIGCNRSIYSVGTMEPLVETFIVGEPLVEKELFIVVELIDCNGTIG